MFHFIPMTWRRTKEELLDRDADQEAINKRSPNRERILLFDLKGAKGF